MSTTTKKSGYSIFAPISLQQRKFFARHIDKKFKRASLCELANAIFNLPNVGNLDRHLLVAEVLWDHDGRHVIFPGDASFFDSLLASKFELSGDARLSLPHKTFILAMPKGFEVDGIQIPSVIVNHTSAGERTARYDLATSLMKSYSLRHSDSDFTEKDTMSLFYHDIHCGEHGVIAQVHQSVEDIAVALKSSSADEYAAYLGEIPQSMVSDHAMDVSHSDRVIQFVTTKILAGISVYMSANNMSELTPGLPHNGRVSISHHKSDGKYSYSHIPSPGPSDTSAGTGSDVITTRRWFFRNLRDARYYRNEYKDLPPGSRWVFVKETTVGQYQPEHIDT